MNKYVRVMHPEEAKTIQKCGFIPPNRLKWDVHQAGTVVFLFDADAVSWKFIRSRSDEVIEECGEAVIISFEGNLSCSEDKSGWSMGGAIVHNGSIPLTELHNVLWFKASRSQL